MKNILVLLLLTILSSCSSRDPRSMSGVDAEFIPYIDRYLAEKRTGMSYDIPIGFTRLHSDTIGLCTRWSNGYRQIQIDPDYWYTASENYRMALIAHELGHCDLNKDHSPSSQSIMYYINLGSQDFEELFDRAFIAYAKFTLPPDDDHDCVRDIEVESIDNK